MTAAQKIAKEKFKKAIAYRQKTGVSLKEAFAHVYGKKVSVFKKTAKKKVIRKKAAKKVGVIKKKIVRKKKTAKKKKPSEQSILNKIHKVKDTVNKLDEAQHKHMSGFNDKHIQHYKNITHQISDEEKQRNQLKIAYKNSKNPLFKKAVMYNIKKYNKLIAEMKTHAKEIKKHI